MSFTLVLTFSLAAAGAAACSSSAASESPADGAAAKTPVGRTGPADDAGAMADLQTSEKWTDPRCRYVTSGAHEVPSPNEEALYRAAAGMGYLDLTESGQEYKFGRMAPVFNVTVTDRGKEVSASCGPASNNKSFGVPVSARRFGSGKFVKQEPYGRTVYEVDFTWVPTPVGDQVMISLSGNMAVPVGEYRAKVFMRKMMRTSIATGANGWMVDGIDDRSAQKLR